MKKKVCRSAFGVLRLWRSCAVRFFSLKSNVCWKTKDPRPKTKDQFNSTPPLLPFPELGIDRPRQADPLRIFVAYGLQAPAPPFPPSLFTELGIYRPRQADPLRIFVAYGLQAPKLS